MLHLLGEFVLVGVGLADGICLVVAARLPKLPASAARARWWLCGPGKPVRFGLAAGRECDAAILSESAVRRFRTRPSVITQDLRFGVSAE
jgi:hypothetical protein